MIKTKLIEQPPFLPATKKEMDSLGWQELDILLISGDAYLDLPAQGPALLGRWLIAHGFKVGLIAQPGWQDEKDLQVMGRPKLFVAISAGSMDSMLAHYTAFRKKRQDDALSPGGRAGARPNRATLVYTGLARRAHPGLPIIIGGVEASLRRLVHYDFWKNKLCPPIILEAKADLLVYGPGEIPLLEIAQRLSNGQDLIGIGGTVRPLNSQPTDILLLPSLEEIEKTPSLLIKVTKLAEQLVHQGQDAPKSWQKAAQRGVLMEPPSRPLSTQELDFIYALPFSRQAHPSYQEKIPALEILKNSITTHRGCGGGCSFCSLALLQGRRIISRSLDSLIDEAKKLGAKKPVTLSDVGAGTANFWGATCNFSEKCSRVSCLYPQICSHLEASQSNWLKMLDKIAALPEIKGLRVASGLRYDLGLKEAKVLESFLKKYVGGQVKVAPEHINDKILKLMHKPNLQCFEEFIKLFDKIQNQTGRQKNKQYIIPYLISAFPGSTDKDMAHLAQWFHQQNWFPKQIQTFIPTPGTLASAMFYAQEDEHGNKIFVAQSDKERLKHHHFLLGKNL